MTADLEQPMAGPSYTTHYPHGGLSTSSGGKGIFVNPDTEEPLEVWVDTDLRGRQSILKFIQVGPQYDLNSRMH